MTVNMKPIQDYNVSSYDDGHELEKPRMIHPSENSLKTELEKQSIISLADASDSGVGAASSSKHLPRITVDNSPHSSFLSLSSKGSHHDRPSSTEDDEDDEDDDDDEYILPEKETGRMARGMRYRIMIVYRTLFSFVWLSNIAAMIAIIVENPGRQWIARISFINLTVAILARQENVVNSLYAICTAVPRSWPLWIRRRAAKIYHFGGVHSGSASAAVAWYIASLGHNTWTRVNFPDILGKPSIAQLTLSYLIVFLLLIMLGTAYPKFRKSHHNIFELCHRFIGWTVLGLIWAQTVISNHDRTRTTQKSLGYEVLRSPEIWMLVVMTLCIASSWFRLRKFAVDADVLSNHAALFHFNYTMPVNGAFVRLSYRPLLEWHSFAVIPRPEATETHARGFSIIISNAGDWTKQTIQRPPSKVWIRGVPVRGVVNISSLFNRVILVGTGSGIGPLLGYIQNPPAPFRVVWSTKSPEETFGSSLCNIIRTQDPGAVIHDTKTQGRPDLVKLTWHQVQEFNAEAVVVIANEKLTRKVVYGMETRGVAAFGAIWDS